MRQWVKMRPATQVTARIETAYMYQVSHGERKSACSTVMVLGSLSVPKTETYWLR